MPRSPPASPCPAAERMGWAMALRSTHHGGIVSDIGTREKRLDMSGTGSRREVAYRLRELPRPVIVLLAARAALRVLPLVGRVTSLGMDASLH